MTDSKSMANWLDLARATDTRRVALLAFLISVAVMLLYRPFSQLEGGDAAFYDYIAQTILRGGIPYRDVVDIKFPAAPYLSALAMVIGKAAGLRDILAVRALHLLMVGLLSAVTFLVAHAYLRSRAAALIAMMIPLMRFQFAEFMMAGTQPKVPMMIFGLLSLLMIVKDRPFWAGCFSMLSCLCWQPGLMFTGAAFLIFSRYLTSWRDWRAAKVLLGATIPFAVMALYFFSRGALDDLWSWTITYNYSVFGPEAKRDAADSVAHLWKVMRRVFEGDIVLVLLGVLGYALYLAERVKGRLRGRPAFVSADTVRDVLLIPPAVYLIFCLINFQAGPDLLPFAPFIGMFSAYVFLAAGRFLKAITRDKERWREAQWETWLPALATAVMLLLTLFRGVTYRQQGGTIRDQDKAIQGIAAVVGPEDEIYVHGTTELLVLLNRANLNPYLDFDWGKDDFLAKKKYNSSFKALIDEMEFQAPKIVALSRLKVVAHRDDLEQWVAEHYDTLEVTGFDGIYIRKPQ